MLVLRSFSGNSCLNLLSRKNHLDVKNYLLKVVPLGHPCNIFLQYSIFSFLDSFCPCFKYLLQKQTIIFLWKNGKKKNNKKQTNKKQGQSLQVFCERIYKKSSLPKVFFQKAVCQIMQICMIWQVFFDEQLELMNLKKN